MRGNTTAVTLLYSISADNPRTRGNTKDVFMKVAVFADNPRMRGEYAAVDFTDVPITPACGGNTFTNEDFPHW
jgi:hypothetical protein